MKVQRCASPVQAIVGRNEGKIYKMGGSKDDGMKVLEYMEKLQHLVPLCPKDRPVSKLEVIQAVIDYIYDLEDALDNEENSKNLDNGPFQQFTEEEDDEEVFDFEDDSSSCGESDNSMETS